MKLYLVRHGETVGNVEGRIQGQTDGELTDEGRMQAQRVAERLRHEDFDCIYSSDLARARNTAEAIHHYHGRTPLRFTEALRERAFGSCEGKLCEEMGFDKHGKWNLPPDAEPNEQMIRRITTFLYAVFKKHSQDSVLFVSHGGIIMRLIEFLEKLDGKDIGFISLQNTAITILEFDEDGKHNLRLLNCVEHLE